MWRRERIRGEVNYNQRMKKSMRLKINIILLFALFATTAVTAEAQTNQKPIQIFILAGQSNMQGHGEMEKGEAGNLRHLVQTNDKYKSLVDADGEWTKRKDVMIYTADRSKEAAHGALTAGFGAFEHTIGPELLFGEVVGDNLDNNVLLIKTAWGGKSLGRDFCPPSAVSDSGYLYLPHKAGDVGYYYIQMLATVQEVLRNLSKYVPNYAGQGYQLAGFAWHQGWNDMMDLAKNRAYEKNLTHLINDVRRDLGEPQLPFVVATSGMRGNVKNLASLCAAQRAVASHPEFKDNVRVVETEDFWREKELSPANQNYHWNRNAESYALIGEAMGRAMVELLNSSNNTPRLRSARSAKDKILAPLPPMGWNSWNAFEGDIDEQKIMRMADIMVESGMRDMGYEYLVIDDAWMANKRGDFEELVADSVKFPGGMRAIGDYIHSKGLKYGIYECRGRVTCQNLPGSYLHERIDIFTFASWGVDYIKMDACFAAQNGRLSSDDFTIYGEAIKDCGREMVLSISDFGQGAWAWGGKKYGQLWRTSMDIYPNMNSVYKCAESSGGSESSHPGFNGLWQFAGANHWNDPDMLQVGNLKGRLEDRVHFSLWCILSAPLMAGNDLRAMDSELREVLMAEELIAVNQDPRAVQGYKIYEADSVAIYNKPLADGTTAVLMLNRGTTPRKASFKWSDVGLKGEQLVRDLWAREDLGRFKGGFESEALGEHEHLFIKVGEPRGELLPMPQPTDIGLYTITKMGRRYLSDMYYIMKEYNHPVADRMFSGEKIEVDGVRYRKGLGCKGTSTVMYKVEGKARTFEAIVSIDGATEEEAMGRFRVLNEDKFGGRVLYDSGKMKWGDKAKRISIDVSDVEFLMLEFTGKGAYGVWADAAVNTK